MRLKEIVLIRHGEYDQETGALYPVGRTKIYKQARDLKQRYSESKISILSSPAKRAWQTADIISDIIGETNVEIVTWLHCPRNFLEQHHVTLALRAIKENGDNYDVLIFTTHSEFVESFPRAWGGTRKLRIPIVNEPPPGSMRILNLEDGTCEYLPVPPL